MGLFRKKEKRSVEAGSVGFTDSLLTAIIGGGSTVTKEQALQIPTIAACVNLIADRISALPIKLYREEGSEVVEIKEDKRLRLLNHDTGDTINAAEMKRMWVRDYFLGKGSYTYIERNIVNEPTGLFVVDEARVAVMTNNDPIHKDYSINVNGKAYFPFQFLKILRNSKGYGTGTSIISENPLSLAIYYNTMKFENSNIRKGGNKRGFLKAANTVGRSEMDALKEAWRDLYSNSEDIKDNIVVLNNGMEFQEASSTSVELQLNENKKSNSIELCKLFCMPADVLCGKADSGTVSQFVQNCLMPPINTIEAALDHDMLTEAEKAGGWYFAFDTTELTRGDFTSRMNGYAVALQNNIYQLDEIREKEDLPPLGFNYIRLGLQDVLLDPKTMQVYTPNTKELVSLDSGKVLTEGGKGDIIEERGNPYHDEKGRFASADGNGLKSVDISGEGGIMETGSGNMVISSIDAPIEKSHTGKGNPNAILTYNVPLNNRQQKLLDKLPEYNSRIIVPRNEVNMADLSALSATTGDEFAMFTKSGERLVVRGNSNRVNVTVEEAKNLSAQGYKWSGHTHPGTDINNLFPSTGDKEILKCFNQDISVIYNSKGVFATFGKE